MRKRAAAVIGTLFVTLIVAVEQVSGGQVPGAASDPDIALSHRDRVYSAEQFSNTVSVIDPVDNALLGVIRLRDPLPASFSPLHRGQLLVHGLGFSADHRTLAVRFALEQPVVAPPGEVWNSNSGSTELIAAVLKKATFPRRGPSAETAQPARRPR
jgi:hypothetical protein